MKSDIDISQKIKLKNIQQIAKKLNIDSKNLYQYGNNIAKINCKNTKKNIKNPKLVLVTAINPTPAGEGKTTVNIGLSMALNKLNKKSISVLREPSMGPVFGIKGGATGGGYSQILPMEDINLHFTGDLHAITSANNLISAAIDNHIYQGNELDIQKTTFKRCLDVNDRALRDDFNITAASEMMAIFCLAKDINNFKDRVDNIIIGYNSKNKPIYAKDLQISGATTAIIKQALNPNLVQTSENTPAIIHGGPFANIAHGCNTIIATELSQKLAKYTIVEAGFGADLGAEKFFNIKSNLFNLKPNVVILVATIRSLKYQAKVELKDLEKENIQALEKGLSHLYQHIDNLDKFGVKTIVSINKFNSDFASEIELLKKKLSQKNIEYSLTEIWKKGSDGGLDLAQKVVNACQKKSNFKPLYSLSDSIENKVEIIAKKIYRATKIEYSDLAKKQLKEIESLAKNAPVCIAKTQTSFSDNPKLLNTPQNHILHIKEIEYNSGSNFVIIKTGKIMTMPGLSKKPAFEKIDVKNDKIIGIF